MSEDRATTQHHRSKPSCYHRSPPHHGMMMNSTRDRSDGNPGHHRRLYAHHTSLSATNVRAGSNSNEREAINISRKSYSEAGNKRVVKIIKKQLSASSSLVDIIEPPHVSHQVEKSPASWQNVAEDEEVRTIATQKTVGSLLQALEVDETMSKTGRGADGGDAASLTGSIINYVTAGSDYGNYLRGSQKAVIHQTRRARFLEEPFVMKMSALEKEDVLRSGTGNTMNYGTIDHEDLLLDDLLKSLSTTRIMGLDPLCSKS